MRRVPAMLFAAMLFVASPASADPFTWTFSGTVDIGHWDLNVLTGLKYVLRVTTDTSAPDQNGFNDFGTYGNLPASIEIEGLGTRILNNFAFIEQFTTSTSDRLRIRGPNGGSESVLQIAKGTLGDPDLLTEWGPVETLGLGSIFKITDPGVPNAPFELIDADLPLSTITISTSIEKPSTQVPEPSTVTLMAVGLALFGRQARNRRRRMTARV